VHFNLRYVDWRSQAVFPRSRTVEVWIIGFYRSHTRRRWQKGTVHIKIHLFIMSEKSSCLWKWCWYYKAHIPFNKSWLCVCCFSSRFISYRVKHSVAQYCQGKCLSVCLTICLSVALRYRGHIGLNSCKIISRLISITFPLSTDPNITDLLQREHPKF